MDMKDEILSFLPEDYPWKQDLHWFDSTTSTNDVLKQMAIQGAPEGTLLIAGHQTGGRGRLGRTFLSPSDVGIYMSLLLRPDCPPRDLMHLTCASAEAACDAIEASAGFRPGIKWINDLVSGGRKLAGILTELGFHPDGRVSWAVIGIGINCCQAEGDFAPEIRDLAGSLAMVSGLPVSRARVAAAMAEAFAGMNAALFDGKQAIMERYQADCITLGKDVQVISQDSVTAGKAICVCDDGALVVEYPDGTRKAVSSGEVSVRGMYGYV